MSESLEKLGELRKKGYRVTPQRETILEFFQKMPEGDHLSAEELLDVFKKNNIKISLATLYRNLKFLVSQGLLRELDFAEAHKHYEYIEHGSIHHHLICNICGNTIEFDDDSLIDVVKKAAAQKNDFQVVDFQLKIFGVCQNCLNKVS